MAISIDELKSRALNIKYFFTDVDGTLTDGSVYYSPEGELLKKFSLRDGSGFYLLQKSGIKTGIITGEESPIVARRAEKLKVDKLIMKAVPKVETLGKFLREEGLSFENVAYIGDSINDIKLMREVGLAYAVGDAEDLTKSVAHVVCCHNGGKGAFYEASCSLLELSGINIESIIDKNL